MIADVILGRKPIVEPSSYKPERLNKSAWGKVADFSSRI